MSKYYDGAEYAKRENTQFKYLGPKRSNELPNAYFYKETPFSGISGLKYAQFIDEKKEANQSFNYINRYEDKVLESDDNYNY